LRKTTPPFGAGEHSGARFSFGLDGVERRGLHQRIGLLNQRRHFWRFGVEQAPVHRAIRLQDWDCYRIARWIKKNAAARIDLAAA